MSPFPPPPLAPAADSIQAAQTAQLPLVAVIEFKWLASGVGQHLHVERMLHDPVYARGVLDAADTSNNSALRRAAQRLRQCLSLAAAAPPVSPPR